MPFSSFNLVGGSAQDLFKFVADAPDSARLRLKGTTLYLRSKRSGNLLNRAIDSLCKITALKRTGASLATFVAFQQKFHVDIKDDVIRQMHGAGRTGRQKDPAECLLKHDIKAGMLKKHLLRGEMQTSGAKEADLNAFEAFGMTKERLLQSLCDSALSQAIEQASRPANAQLTSAQLALELMQMLAEPEVRKAIKENQLTAAEASAMGFYMNRGFVEVQEALRKQDETTAYYKPLVYACHGAFAKLPPLPTEITMVYRGTDHYTDAVQGSAYTDRAFVSTSKDENIARIKFPGSHLLKIAVPNGASARDVSVLARKDAGEAEVLFPPGTRFRIDEVEQLSGDPDDGKTTIVTLWPLPPP